VWLLDGLDEVVPPPDERFYQAVVNLPGLKVLSCRTAVYETLRREADRYKDQEYELLGLKSADQYAFLAHALGGDARRAKGLHHRLQHNSQLRLLAGNPLMLSLVARVSDHMALPATRSAFYQAAVSELWRRRLARHPDAEFRTRERDQVLTELAERMGMMQIQAPLAWLEEAANRVAGPDGRPLIRYLHHAGIVRPHSWEKVEFVHLTFQEFYLAQALRQGTFQKVLEHHWRHPRYEETLGLLVSLLWQGHQYADIDHGIRWPGGAPSALPGRPVFGAFADG
jgi:predicted NACHT family NTPase